MRDITSKYYALCSAFFVVFSVLVASGCGGGGSDGGSSTPGTNARGTGLRILHGVIEAEPVDVYSSVSEEMVSEASFAENTFYSSIKTGDQIVRIERTRSPGQVIGNLPLNAVKDGKYSLLLYGDKTKFGLKSNLIFDAKPEIEKGMSAVRVVHGIVGAGSVNGEIGDSSITDATLFGQASEYLSIEPGEFILKISRVTDRKVLYNSAKLIEPDKFYTFFITGEVDYFVVVRDFQD